VQISAISGASGARLEAQGAVHVTGCAVIKDLSGYQQLSNPVSSVAAPAARPKTEKYSHVGSLIVVKYYYFSHFR